jgi:hypothetical protein
MLTPETVLTAMDRVATGSFLFSHTNHRLQNGVTGSGKGTGNSKSFGNIFRLPQEHARLFNSW